MRSKSTAHRFFRERTLVVLLMMLLVVMLGLAIVPRSWLHLVTATPPMTDGT